MDSKRYEDSTGKTIAVCDLVRHRGVIRMIKSFSDQLVEHPSRYASIEFYGTDEKGDEMSVDLVSLANHQGGPTNGLKHFIGDGVYVEDREHAIRLTTNNLLIRLTTNNGLGVTNEIYLDDYVMRALIEYWKKARKVGDGKL